MNRVVTIRPVELAKPGQYIKFGTVYNKGRFTLTVAKNSNGDWVHGHTPAELLEYKNHKVNSDEFWLSYRLVLTQDIKRLNIDTNEKDRIDYRVAKTQEVIANSVAEITPRTKFVMYDEQEEAKVVNRKHEHKMEAYLALNKMSAVEKREFLTLFGMRTKDASDEIVQRRILGLVEQDAEKFNEKYKDERKDTKMLLYQLIEWEILKKTKEGVYYKELLIGMDERSAINYLDDPFKQDLRIEFENRLIEIKNR